MERKNIKRFGLRWGLPVLLALVLILLVVRLNQVEKTEIISRAGQTFETGVVTEILEDNMQEDGTRVGQQTVVVRMTSGVKKGQLPPALPAGTYRILRICLHSGKPMRFRWAGYCSPVCSFLPWVR